MYYFLLGPQKGMRKHLSEPLGAKQNEILLRLKNTGGESRGTLHTCKYSIDGFFS